MLVVFLHQGVASRRVLGDTHVTALDCQIEHIAKQDQQPVATSRSVGLAVLCHEGDEIASADLIQMSVFKWFETDGLIS
jgi:hypothetical protein